MCAAVWHTSGTGAKCVVSTLTLDAEQAALSAMLMEPPAIDTARAKLRAEDFDDRRHGAIFAAILRISERGEAADPLTVASELEHLGELEEAGGKDYIGYLIDVVPSAANLEYHLSIVLEAAQHRALKRSAADFVSWLDDTSLRPPELAQRMMNELEAIAEQRDTLPRAVSGLQAAAMEPLVWCVQDLAVAGEILVIAGEGGSKKTSGVVHLAAAISMGARAFGHFATRPSTVLIASAEDSPTIIFNRLEAFAAGHNWKRDEVLGRVHVFPTTDVSLTDPVWQAHLIREAKRLSIGFLVFDPLADLIGGKDENSNSDLRAVMKFLRRVAGETGATPSVIHHAGKAVSDRRLIDRIRGASALVAAARSILYFEETETGARVQHLKMSRAPKVANFALTLKVEAEPTNRGVWREASLLYQTAQVENVNRAERFVLTQVAASPRLLTSSALRDTAKGTGINQMEVSRAIAKLEKTGQIAFENGGRGRHLWFLTTLPDSSDKLTETRLPALPEGRPATTNSVAVDLAPPEGWAGKVKRGLGDAGNLDAAGTEGNPLDWDGPWTPETPPAEGLDENDPLDLGCDIPERPS